jgi:hypothetical protein
MRGKISKLLFLVMLIHHVNGWLFKNWIFFKIFLKTDFLKISRFLFKFQIQFFEVFKNFLVKFKIIFKISAHGHSIHAIKYSKLINHFFMILEGWSLANERSCSTKKSGWLYDFASICQELAWPYEAQIPPETLEW